MNGPELAALAEWRHSANTRGCNSPKGIVTGAATNAQASSTSSKHAQQAYFDGVGGGGRALELPFGEQQLEDVGRAQLAGWVVDGATWAEGPARVNAKWCKSSIELSGFSGVEREDILYIYIHLMVENVEN